MQVRNTFWGILILLMFFVLGAITTRAGVFFRLIYLVALLLAVCWVWTRNSIMKVHVERATRGLKQQLGHVFEEQFTVHNSSTLTKSWIEIEDGSGLPSSGATRVIATLKANSVRNYSGYTLLSRRGEFQLSPTYLHSGDPFGIFVFRKKLENNERLLVLPYLVDIKNLPLPSGRLPGGIAVRRRTPEIQPPRAAGVREYAPGDSLNRIHWPSTAKKDRWMVKEFEQDPQADVWILLDAQSSVHIRQRDEEKIKSLEQIPLWWLNRAEFKLPVDTFEYSVSVAGSVARYFCRSGQVVGFSANGSRRSFLPSEKGERQLSKILETLALLNSDGSVPLAGLVESLSGFIQRGSTVILITPSNHPSVISGTASLIRRGLKPMIIFIDPTSFGAHYSVDGLQRDLVAWKIPFTKVMAGQNIKDTIEQGFTITG